MVTFWAKLEPKQGVTARC